MIVYNLDLVGLPFMPLEADAPLVVDPDAVLPKAVTFQSFEPVSPNGSQVIETGRCMEPSKPFSTSPLNAAKLAAAEAVVQCLRLFASKRSNHSNNVLRAA
jgi:hypothetical protein